MGKKLIAGMLIFALMITGIPACAEEAGILSDELGSVNEEYAEDDTIPVSGEEPLAEDIQNGGDDLSELFTGEGGAESDDVANPNPDAETDASIETDAAVDNPENAPALPDAQTNNGIGDDSETDPALNDEDLEIISDESSPETSNEDEDLVISAASINEDEVAAASNPIELQDGVPTEITFPDNVYEVECKLTFGPSASNNPREKMRYFFSADNAEFEIFCELTYGGQSISGSGYINDVQGVHKVFIRRRQGQSSTVRITAKRVIIQSIVALDPTLPNDTYQYPQLVDGPQQLAQMAYREEKIRITYKDGTTQDLLMTDFGGNGGINTIGSTYYSDESANNPIQTSDLSNYYYTDSNHTIVYQKLQLDPDDRDPNNPNVDPEQRWVVIAKFRLVPYTQGNFRPITLDAAALAITGSQGSSEMFYIDVTEEGYYEFIGQKVMIMLLGNSTPTPAGTESWGGYRPNEGFGSAHAYLYPGINWVMAVVREGGSGNIQPSISCHKQAILKSVNLKVPQGEVLTWESWGRLKWELTYYDPKNPGTPRTFEADIDDYNPHDGEYYFEPDIRIERVGGLDSERWKVSFARGFDAQYSQHDHLNVSYETELTIYNVFIAEDADASVGDDTSSVVDQSLDSVLNGTGCVVSAGTTQNIEKKNMEYEQRKANEDWTKEALNNNKTHFSANLEIKQNNDAGNLQRVQNQLGSGDELKQVLDASIVIRGDTDTLGNIEETQQQLEMAIRVSGYNPNKKYSIVRLHNGAATKLTPFRIVQQGSNALLWFRSNLFSTFAVVEGDKTAASTPEPAQTTQPATPPAAPLVVAAPPVPEVVPEKITVTKSPTLSSVKAAAKGKITIKWQKFKQTKKTKEIWKKIKKVQIQYSTDSSFQTGTVSKLVGKNKTKLDVKGLQKNTMYYVRIRYTDGTGGYSKWSKVKRAKTKKK